MSCPYSPHNRSAGCPEFYRRDLGEVTTPHSKDTSRGGVCPVAQRREWALERETVGRCAGAEALAGLAAMFCVVGVFMVRLRSKVNGFGATDLSIFALVEPYETPPKKVAQPCRVGCRTAKKPGQTGMESRRIRRMVGWALATRSLPPRHSGGIRRELSLADSCPTVTTRRGSSTAGAARSARRTHWWGFRSARSTRPVYAAR